MPNEVLYKILSRVDLNDLLNFSLVSKYCNKILSQSFYRYLSVRRFRDTLKIEKDLKDYKRFFFLENKIRNRSRRLQLERHKRAYTIENAGQLDINIIVTGERRSGSTSLISTYICGVFEENESSNEELTQKNRFMLRNKRITLQLVDFPHKHFAEATEEIEKLPSSWSKSDVFVFAVDVSVKIDFLQLKRKQHLVRRCLGDIPIVIFATKCDLADSDSTRDLQEFCKMTGTPSFSCTCHDPEGINFAFSESIASLLKMQSQEQYYEDLASEENSDFSDEDDF